MATNANFVKDFEIIHFPAGKMPSNASILLHPVTENNTRFDQTINVTFGNYNFLTLVKDLRGPGRSIDKVEMHAWVADPLKHIEIPAEALADENINVGTNLYDVPDDAANVILYDKTLTVSRRNAQLFIGVFDTYTWSYLSQLKLFVEAWCYLDDGSITKFQQVLMKNSHHITEDEFGVDPGQLISPWSSINIYRSNIPHPTSIDAMNRVSSYSDKITYYILLRPNNMHMEFANETGSATFTKHDIKKITINLRFLKADGTYIKGDNYTRAFGSDLENVQGRTLDSTGNINIREYSGGDNIFDGNKILVLRLDVDPDVKLVDVGGMRVVAQVYFYFPTGAYWPVTQSHGHGQYLSTHTDPIEVSKLPYYAAKQKDFANFEGTWLKDTALEIDPYADVMPLYDPDDAINTRKADLALKFNVNYAPERFRRFESAVGLDRSESVFSDNALIYVHNLLQDDSVGTPATIEKAASLVHQKDGYYYPNALEDAPRKQFGQLAVGDEALFRKKMSLWNYRFQIQCALSVQPFKDPNLVDKDIADFVDDFNPFVCIGTNDRYLSGYPSLNPLVGFDVTNIWSYFKPNDLTLVYDPDTGAAKVLFTNQMERLLPGVLFFKIDYLQSYFNYVQKYDPKDLEGVYTSFNTGLTVNAEEFAKATYASVKLSRWNYQSFYSKNPWPQLTTITDSSVDRVNFSFRPMQVDGNNVPLIYDNKTHFISDDYNNGESGYTITGSEDQIGKFAFNFYREPEIIPFNELTGLYLFQDDDDDPDSDETNPGNPIAYIPIESAKNNLDLRNDTISRTALKRNFVIDLPNDGRDHKFYYKELTNKAYLSEERTGRPLLAFRAPGRSVEDDYVDLSYAVIYPDKTNAASIVVDFVPASDNQFEVAAYAIYYKLGDDAWILSPSFVGANARRITLRGLALGSDGKLDNVTLLVAQRDADGNVTPPDGPQVKTVNFNLARTNEYMSVSLTPHRLSGDARSFNIRFNADAANTRDDIVRVRVLDRLVPGVSATVHFERYSDKDTLTSTTYGMSIDIPDPDEEFTLWVEMTYSDGVLSQNDLAPYATYRDSDLFRRDEGISISDIVYEQSLVGSSTYKLNFDFDYVDPDNQRADVKDFELYVKTADLADPVTTGVKANSAVRTLSHEVADKSIDYEFSIRINYNDSYTSLAKNSPTRTYSFPQIVDTLSTTVTAVPQTTTALQAKFVFVEAGANARAGGSRIKIYKAGSPDGPFSYMAESSYNASREHPSYTKSLTTAELSATHLYFKSIIEYNDGFETELSLTPVFDFVVPKTRAEGCTIPTVSTGKAVNIVGSTYNRPVTATFLPLASNQRLDVASYSLYEVNTQDTTEWDKTAVFIGRTSDALTRTISYNLMDISKTADSDVLLIVGINYTDGSSSLKGFSSSKVFTNPFAGHADTVSVVGAEAKNAITSVTGAPGNNMEVTFLPGVDNERTDIASYLFFARFENDEYPDLPTAVITDTSLRSVSHNIYQSEGLNHYFKVSIRYADNSETTLADMPEFKYQFTDYGDHDSASFQSAPTVVSHDDVDGLYTRTELRASFVANPNNAKTDIDYFALYEKASETDAFKKLADIPLADAQNYQFKVLDWEGPEHQFKVQIVFSDTTVTSLSLASIMTWVDPNYGDDDGTLVASINPGGRSTELATPLVLTFEMSTFSERQTYDHYFLQVTKKFGTTYAETEEIRVDSLTYTYTALDVDGPTYSFKLIPVFIASNGQATRLDTNNCASKEWTNPVFGANDGVIIGDITKKGETTVGGYAADVIDIPFTLKPGNDRDSEIIAFDLVQLEADGVTEKTLLSVDKDDRRIPYTYVRHNEGRTGTYYVLIRYASGVSSRDSKATSPKTYTAEQYGDNDVFNVGTPTKGTISIDSGRRRFEISANVVRGVSNDRTDVLKYSLFASKGTEDNYALIGEIAASVGNRVSGYLYSDQGPDFKLKIQVTWADQTTNLLANAAETPYTDPAYGIYDFGSVQAITPVRVEDSLQWLTASFTVSALNDRKNPVKYSLYWDRGAEGPLELATSTDIDTPFSFGVPVDQTENLTFYVLLSYAGGGVTTVDVAPKKLWTLASHGEGDHVVIDQVIKDTYYETPPAYYSLTITAHAAATNNRPSDDIEKYMLYAKRESDDNYLYTNLDYIKDSPINTATFSYKAYNEDYPDWSFKVLADFGNDITALNTAPVQNIRIIDPANTDHAIAGTPVIGTRESTVDGWGTNVIVPFQISDDNYRKTVALVHFYVKIGDGQYVKTKTKPFVNFSELEFPYFAKDSDKPKWEFWIELEFSEGPNSVLANSFASELINRDPEGDDNVLVDRVVTGPLSRDGSNRLQNSLSVFFSQAADFGRIDIQQYQLYASTVGPELNNFSDISAVAVDTADHFTYNAVRGLGPVWYFRAKAKYNDGSLTDSLQSLSWRMDDWGDNDRVIPTAPVAGQHILAESGDYTPLNLAFTPDVDNDRPYSDVVGYKLYVRTKNTNNAYQAVAGGFITPEARQFVYNAKDIDGPEFVFKILITYAAGETSEIDQAREIEWVFSQYSGDDSGEVTHLAEGDRGLDANGDDGTYLNITFAASDKNDRHDVIRYFLHASTDGGISYQLVATSNDPATPIRYFARDIDGPEFKFKIQLEFSDNQRTQLSSSVATIWPLDSYGDLDHVIIDKIDKGPLIKNSQGNWQNDLEINFHLPQTNDRLDQTAYILQTSRPGQTNWEDVGSNNENLFKFLFTAEVSEGPYWNFRILLEYGDKSRSDVAYAPVTYFQNVDPDDTDTATISNIRVESIFSGDETGSNLLVTYAPSPTNRRTDVKVYKLYRDLTSDGLGYRLVSSSLTLKELDTKVYNAWVERINYKIQIEFIDGSVTNLEKTVPYVFDNRDPLGEDRIDIVDVAVQQRTIYKSKAATELYITFASDENNKRTDIVSYTLKVKRNEAGEYDKFGTLYSAGQGFTYFAVDDEGPTWDFVVIAEFENGDLTDIDKTLSERYYNPDPLDTDQVEVKNIGIIGDTWVNGKQAKSLVINYLAKPTNLRTEVRQYTLAVSKDGVDGDYVDSFNESGSNPFYYNAVEVEGPVWWFKVYATFNDNSKTNKDNAPPLSYVFDNYGKDDYAKIVDVTPGAKLNDGQSTEIIISFIPGENNDRVSVSNYMLMYKTSEMSEYKPALTATDSNAPFKYVANHSSGPSWEFWVKINFTDGSSTTFDENYGSSYVDTSLDKAIVTHVYKGERFTISGRSGNSLIIQFKEDDNNAR